MDGLCCSYSGLSLSGSNGTESNKKFVVDCPGVVEKRANNFLDSVLAGIIKKIRCITLSGVRCVLDHRRWAGMRRERVLACKGKDV